MAGLMDRAQDPRNAHDSRDRGRGLRTGEPVDKTKYFRKDFGWILGKEEVATWGKYKKQTEEAAAKIREQQDRLNSQYSEALAQGQGQIAAAYDKAGNKIPGWKDPAYSDITLMGDGETTGHTYKILAQNKKAFIDGMTQQGYYKHIVKDGRDYIAMKGYGKEGYEFANDYISKQDQAIAAQKSNYLKEVGAAQGQLAKAEAADIAKMKAQAEAEVGPVKSQLAQQHKTVSGMYDNDVASVKGLYNKTVENKNQSIQELDIKEATKGRGLSG